MIDRRFPGVAIVAMFTLLRSLFDLSLTLTTVLAVLLNQIFSVRGRKRSEGTPETEREIAKT